MVALLNIIFIFTHIHTSRTYVRVYILRNNKEYISNNNNNNNNNEKEKLDLIKCSKIKHKYDNI